MISSSSTFRYSRGIATCSIPYTKRSFLSRATVDLSFEQFSPKSPRQEPSPPLVICHGLFGSKQNWRSLGKSLAQRLNIDVYALDLRNHGASPHSKLMDYTTMASDVLRFCKQQKLPTVNLMGHSMGGKVAMTAALSSGLPTDLLANLIIVDIAPAKGAISPEFRQYATTLLQIENAGVRSRKEADEMLQLVEPDPSIRAFLLTNLTFVNKQFKFRVPLEILQNALENLGDFPFEPGEREWFGRTLFIKGDRSNYINKNNTPLAKTFFPNMMLKTLDTGHLVHAEKPDRFIKLVDLFINPSERDQLESDI